MPKPESDTTNACPNCGQTPPIGAVAHICPNQSVRTLKEIKRIKRLRPEKGPCSGKEMLKWLNKKQ